MNLYSNKQRWKVFLIILAIIIVVITLWYSNYIVRQIQQEEKNQIELWSRAIKKRAQLVVFAEKIFDQLKEDEKKDADLLATGLSVLKNPDPNDNLSLASDLVSLNNTIPILIYNSNDSLILSKNIPKGKKLDLHYTDSLRKAIEKKNEPIFFKVINWKLFYDDSNVFTELQHVMDDLINSFISETVINTASSPVLLTDSSKTKVIRFHNVDSLIINDPVLVKNKLQYMQSEHDPIELDLPGLGKQYVYYEDSLILKQLKYFPFVQLVLIGLFLLGSYLIFSAFRKAEQNQVWVGMAKETAHQLGTPLSGLMAWVSILESMGLDADTVTEIDKDVKRLEMITDRFSKIGAAPDLKPENMLNVVNNALDYLSTRVGRKVVFEIKNEEEEIYALVSKPLFGWVMENLVKNAIDAMNGVGKLTVLISQKENDVFIDVCDTGKGIEKSKIKTVFEPGFTTKKRGWGLGLSLVKRIIESYHNGKIYVRNSEVGKGTDFRIVLRRAED